MIQQVKRIISNKNSFLNDVLKLVSGTTFAQALGILVAPILTRLYGPEAYGIAGLFISITSIIGVITCLRYELSIMLPEKDKDAVNLVGVSLGFTFLISGALVGIVWLGHIWFSKSITSLLGVPELERYLWLIPISVFVTGVFLALSYWTSRTKKFGRLSIARINRSVFTTGTQLGAGLSGHAVAGSLIGANVIGTSISTLIISWQVWKDDRHLFRTNLQWSKMLSEAKRYRKFPIYDTWGALINSLSWQLPLILLTGFFSATIAGYYSLTYRILGLPMGFIGAALAQVFFQRTSQAKSKNELTRLVEDMFRHLVLIGFFPVIILSVIGKDLFIVVFGDQWAEAGIYAQLLSFWAFFWFVVSPMSTLFSVLEKQRLFLGINITIFLTRILALGIGGFWGNARWALLLFGFTGVLVYGFESLMIIRIAGVSYNITLKILAKSFFTSIPAALLLLILQWLGVPPWYRVILAGLLVAGYLLYIVQSEIRTTTWA